MTITARFASKCPACGYTIEPGARVEWSRGEKARHTVCPTTPPAIDDPTVLLAAAPARSTTRTNRKGDHCLSCHAYLKPGAGELIFCPEDSGCLEHHDYSGYHVACLDRAACDARRVAARAEERVRKAQRAVRAQLATLTTAIGQAAYAAVREPLVAGRLRVSQTSADIAGERLGEHDRTILYARVGGGAIEHWSSYDDSRQHVWLTLDELRARVAAEMESDEWSLPTLIDTYERYDGCEGSTEVRAALWVAAEQGERVIVAARS